LEGVGGWVELIGFEGFVREFDLKRFVVLLWRGGLGLVRIILLGKYTGRGAEIGEAYGGYIILLGVAAGRVGGDGSPHYRWTEGRSHWGGASQRGGRESTGSEAGQHDARRGCWVEE